MRWIDRGPEPPEVAGYAQQFTQGWIDYFRNQTGPRPADFLWAVFRPTLGSRSSNICWYCERRCDANDGSEALAPTVDHFRPLSRFPHLAYVWSNWIFSCQSCNAEKGNKWPETGYINPCAGDVTERPEKYLAYDADTGELIPQENLSQSAYRKASQTIYDLGLNRLDVRFYRLIWTRQFVADLLSIPVSEKQAFVEYIAQQPIEYAGVTGMVVEQMRRAGRI